MLGKIFDFVVGKKYTFIAGLVLILTIAGLIGYIRYDDALHSKTEGNLQNQLTISQRDVRDRDRDLAAQRQENTQYEQRVQQMSAAMDQMQGKIAQNSQQRSTDYNNMTRPHPVPGQSADTKDLENAANTGMNALWSDLVKLSQPLSNTVQDTPNASK